MQLVISNDRMGIHALSTYEISNVHTQSTKFNTGWLRQDHGVFLACHKHRWYWVVHICAFFGGGCCRLDTDMYQKQYGKWCQYESKQSFKQHSLSQASEVPALWRFELLSTDVGYTSLFYLITIIFIQCSSAF